MVPILKRGGEEMGNGDIVGWIFWVLIFVYVVLSWHYLSVIQNKMGLVIFSTLENYFFGKLVWCTLFGWVIIPVGLLASFFRSKK